MSSDTYDADRPEAGGFESLVDRYLDELFYDEPAKATFLGRSGLDDRSPDLTAAAIQEREARADRRLEEFTQVPAEGLTPSQQIDRDLVGSVLQGHQAQRDWEVWRRDPAYYLSPALMGVFTLFLRRPLPDPELTEAAAARLAAVPDLLAAAQANLDPSLTPRVFIERGIGQCRAGEIYARDMVYTEVQDERLRTRLDEAGAGAADAFARCREHLEELNNAAHGEWAIGEARYTALLRQAELFDLDTAQLHQRGQAAWAELDAEMTEVARIIDPDQATWQEVAAECATFRPETPDEMREAYEEETARTRAFLAEYDLVTFPEGESCEVVPSPPFQRPILAVASYFQPPAFATSRVGRFNVPYPPAGTAAAEIAQRLADNNFHSIPTITAHEAYPGHHWHLTAMLDTSPLRKVHRSAYFTEGWALYAEKVMREHGYFTDPRDELMHLGARIFRAARIVVDTALHSGDMTFEQAVTEMQQRAGLTEAVARAEVGRYCAWPTQASSYLTGCLEIERLRDRWQAEQRGDLRSFHDTLARTGSLPIALAEKAVFS